MENITKQETKELLNSFWNYLKHQTDIKVNEVDDIVTIEVPFLNMNDEYITIDLLKEDDIWILSDGGSAIKMAYTVNREEIDETCQNWADAFDVKYINGEFEKKFKKEDFASEFLNFIQLMASIYFP